jgi:hypothetical protein
MKEYKPKFHAKPQRSQSKNIINYPAAEQRDIPKSIESHKGRGITPREIKNQYVNFAIFAALREI